MKCSLCHDLLDDFIRGKLDKRSAELVENHLDTCPNCDQEYQALKTLIGAFERIPDAIMPTEDLDNFLPGIWEKIDAKARRRRHNWFTRLVPAIATAAVIFILVINYLPVTDFSYQTTSDQATVDSADSYSLLVQTLFGESDSTYIRLFEDELYSGLESYDGYDGGLDLNDFDEQGLELFEEKLTKLYDNAG